VEQPCLLLPCRPGIQMKTSLQLYGPFSGMLRDLAFASSCPLIVRFSPSTNDIHLWSVGFAIAAHLSTAGRPRGNAASSPTGQDG